MNRCAATLATAGMLALAAAPPATADLRPVRLGAWTVNSSFVPEMARVGNTIYVAGAFTSIAPRANLISRFAEFTKAGATPARPTPVVGGGSVFALADDGAGGWFVGGNFTTVSDTTGAFVPRVGLAHILPDGTLDAAFAPVLNGGVNAMVRDGAVLYIGGSFTSVDGAARGRGAAFDVGPGTLRAWNPAVSDGTVFAIAPAGGVVYLGGTFTQTGGAARVGLAAVDAVTGGLQALTADLAASPSPFGLSLVVSGNTLFVGGFFDTIGGIARRNLAALDRTTGAVLPFTANTNTFGVVRALLLTGGRLLLAGTFTDVNGTARVGAAAVDPASGTVGAWNPQVVGEVNAWALEGDTLYLAGTFRSLGGELRANAGAVSATSGAVLPWNPGLSDTTWAIGSAATTVVTGGVATLYGAQARRNLAAFDLVTGDLLPLYVEFNGTLRGVTATPSALYVSGFFTSVNGVARNWFAAVDRHTGAVLPWNPDATVGVNNTSGGRVVLLRGARAFIGGFFGMVGGQPREGLAEVDATTGAPTAFNAGMTGAAADLRVSGNTLYVAGQFTQLGGQPRNNVGALDLATLAVTTFNPNVTGTGSFVARMRVLGNRLFFGGNFSAVGGVARTHAAAVDAASAAVDAFAPVLDGTVWDLEARNSLVFLGGAFSTANGQARRALAAVDSATGTSTGAFDAGVAQGEVRYLRGDAEGLLAGGNNLAASGLFQNVVYFPEGAVGGPPGPPSTPTARIVNARLELFWAAPTTGGAPADYLVEAGTGPALANIGTLPNGTASPFFSFNGVPPGTYYLRVRARNAAGVGLPSPEIAFSAGVAGCTGAPQAPLFSYTLSGVNVTLAWPHAVSANGPAYQLRVGTAIGRSNVATINLGSVNAFSAAGAPGAFFGRMLSSSACGVSAPSGDHLISIGGVQPPAAPIARWTAAAGTVQIDWDAVPGAVGYRVDAGAGPLLGNIASVAVATSTLTVPGVPPGTYYVRVYAIGAAGPSLPSNEMAIVVP